MNIDSDIGIIEAIVATLMTVVAPVAKTFYSRLVAQIKDLKEELEKTTEMLNGRIDKRRDNLDAYVQRTDTKLSEIDLKLERILTLMEK